MSKRVLGINARNILYINQFNRRSFYPIADDKLLFKQRAIEHDVPVPELLATIDTYGGVKRFDNVLADHDSFVLKPAHGAGGEGVMVLDRTGTEFTRSNGTIISAEDIRFHLSNMLAGLFSLGGLRDNILVERKVVFDDCFTDIAWQGVPDVRLIVFLGVPVMAMIRLPTSSSNGRANLHQGAIGAGIHIGTGKTTTGVQGTSFVDLHPDTEETISNIQIPSWEEILRLGIKCFHLSQLGYLGVDVVLDKERGPLVLEINARPGLAIQIANRTGLQQRLDSVEQIRDSLKSDDDVLQYVQEQF